MTTEEQPIDQQQLQEIQKRREELSREMEHEVQRIRDYIRYGTWTPRPSEALKS